MLPADQTPKMLAMQHIDAVFLALATTSFLQTYRCGMTRPRPAADFNTSVHGAKPNPHELVMLNLHRLDAHGTRDDLQRCYGTARSIAKLLGRSPSTVSREISRNGGYDRYRAALATG
jgi:hypothetical protein